MPRELVKGNEAVAEAAIRAGCRFYFGYPITPQTELLEYMAKRMPEVGGVFLQTESELAAIAAVYGAAAAGKRAMTSSSAPGISLKQEGISALVAARLPCLIVDVTRAGPGLGRIRPAQSDYFQATRGGGHGDYRLIVFGPASVQEMADLTVLAFDLADQYRTPTMILADGILGQMMEPIEWKPVIQRDWPRDWAVSGAEGRPRRVVLSAPFTDEEMLQMNEDLQRTYLEVSNKEQRWEELDLHDAEVVVVAFGSAARVAMEAVERAREEGIKVGLLRPITLWPFPTKAFAGLPMGVKALLTVEMNAGQMVEDVRLAVRDRVPVHFFGYGGGWMPSPKEIEEEIDNIWKQLR